MTEEKFLSNETDTATERGATVFTMTPSQSWILLALMAALVVAVIAVLVNRENARIRRETERQEEAAAPLATVTQLRPRDGRHLTLVPPIADEEEPYDWRVSGI